LSCFVVNLYSCFSSLFFIFSARDRGWGWGAPVELFCCQFIFLYFSSLFFISAGYRGWGGGATVELFYCQFVSLYFSSLFFFQLETGVGAGGLLLNRQFPPPLTIEHGPDITKEKKNHAKWVEHVYFNFLVFLQSIQ